MHTRERVAPMTVRVSTLKGPDAGLYYVEALPGYYLDAGEPIGLWRGEGAALLGLEHEVDDDAFLALMAECTGGFRTPVLIESVHRFRGFRTPRRRAA